MHRAGLLRRRRAQQGRDPGTRRGGRGGGCPNLCGGFNGPLPDGGNPCVPTTCAALGYTCGPAGDSCGGVIQCGSSCPAPQFCGGGGPSKCGGNVNVAPDGATVTLCQP